MTLRLVLAVLAATALSGCSGRSCDDLAALRADRDAARAAYLELAQSGGATPAETEQADEDLHALERRVHDVEQECVGR